MEKEKSKKKEPAKAVSTSPQFSSRQKQISARGRIFKGPVVRKFPNRIAIEFERTLYVPKYERFMKKKTRIHARLPAELADKVQIGDIVKVQECRPLSKIINFIVIEKLSKEKK